MNRVIKKGHDCKLPYACYSIDIMKDHGTTTHIDDTHFKFVPAKDMDIKELDDLANKKGLAAP